jgi:hypothetical protein
MTINAGIWIDHHRAVVVLLKDRVEETVHFTADRDNAPRSRNDFVAEDKLERKATIHLNQYYDEVIASLHSANVILVIGPGEAKGEFTKRLKGTHLKAQIAHAETADKLTDPQIAAYVRNYFG